MNSRQFNGKFRPLVNQAWLQQCQITGVAANNKTAQDRWYREQLRSCCGIQSTKTATSRQQQALINWFSSTGTGPARLHVAGWSDAQNYSFSQLASEAFILASPDATMDDWLDDILRSCGVTGLDVPDGRQAFDRTESFDQVMASLAIIANNERWLLRTAVASERRMRWQITRFIGDLEWLQKRHVDTSYVQAIWRQAKLQPDDLEAAPVETLAKALAMIDTHIRRLCKDYDIRPMELPSRAHPHARPVAIREDNNHLHVGHTLEHADPVHVTPAMHESLPF